MKRSKNHSEHIDPSFDPHFLPEHLKPKTQKETRAQSFQTPQNTELKSDLFSSNDNSNEDLSLSKKHKIAPSVFRLQVVESLLLIFSPAVLLFCATLRVPLLIVPLFVLNFFIIHHFPKVMNAPTIVGSKIVGSICAVLTIIPPLAIDNQLTNGGYVDVLALPIFVGFLATFVIEALRKVRQNLILSVSISISLSLLVLCSSGYLMTWQLYSGVYFGFFVLCLVPVITLGIWQLILASWEKIKLMPVNRTIRLITGFAVEIIACLLTYAVLLASSEFIAVRLLDLFLALTVVILAYFITYKQFPKVRSISHAFVRASFPLLLLGGAIYIVVVLIQY